MRRAGEGEEAEKIWLEMIESRAGGVQPYIEMAKLLEHRKRDFAGALEMTERAMALLGETRLREDRTVQETENALQYRRRRLKKRLASRMDKKE